MSTPGANPRSVTPGIETQEYIESDDGRVFHRRTFPLAGRYIALDWIRCTGPETLVSELIHTIDGWSGSSAKPSGRAKWFHHGMTWEPGFMLSWGHSAGICQMDVQGGQLCLFDGEARIDLLRELLSMGLKPTRLDGALDFVGQDIALYEHAVRACKARELCLLRKHAVSEEFDNSGAVLRRHLRLGARSSPVCARIYDKGLEQGLTEFEQWERLETEWKGERAVAVASELMAAGSAWGEVLVGLVLGALDFREVNGRTERSRRPRLQWWEDVIGDAVTIKTAPAQEDQTFAKWKAWARAVIGKRLAELAQHAGLSIGSVAERLFADISPGNAGGAIVAGFLCDLVETPRQMRPSPNGDGNEI